MSATPDLFIGLMSGTSMDAVDGILADLSADIPRLLSAVTVAVPHTLRKELQALGQGGTANELEQLARLDVRVGRLFAETAKAVLTAAGIPASAVRAIGSHGQTVRHHPLGPEPFTVQIGDPNIIAETTGITTVADFRRRDIAAGGQGAPLVPAFHSALFRSSTEDRVVVNIGGIANITTLPAAPSTPVTGFDTGPGNTLLDGWIYKHLGKPLDESGQWAGKGNVDTGLLDRLLADPYFKGQPPKSTGPEHFSMSWLERALAGSSLSSQDVQATLCELTAASISEAIRSLSPCPRRVLICGGGAHNQTLMRRLAALLPDTAVESTAHYGLDPDWVEAVAFAWLARQTLAGQPGNLPAVTGARHPVVLGGIWPGNASGNPDQ